MGERGRLGVGARRPLDERRYERARRPRALRAQREVDIRADCTAFEIPDEFVVGYGIDFAQRNRNLPYIGKVSFPDGDA